MTDKSETDSVVRLNINGRLELESKVLAAALKQSFERKDKEGINLAHKQLFLIMQEVQKAQAKQAEITQKMTAVEEAPPESVPQAAPAQAQMESGGNSSSSHSAVAAAVAAPPAPPPPPQAPPLATRSDIYEVLNVSQMSSYHDIHISFLRTLKKMLREIAATPSIDRRPLLKRLQTIWISRDILMDPITRTDYDLRLKGLRGQGSEAAAAPDDGKNVEAKDRSLLRIGELLMLCGLLEAGELDIACDMHKAMPGVRFGAFLLKQGFIHERELDEALLGQRLLRRGWLTTAQLQVGMQILKQSGIGLAKTLADRGWVSPQDLQSVTESSQDSSSPLVRPSAEDKPAPPDPRTSQSTTNGGEGKSSAQASATVTGSQEVVGASAAIWPQSALPSPPKPPPLPPGVKITTGGNNQPQEGEAAKKTSFGDFLRANAQNPSDAAPEINSNLKRELARQTSEANAANDSAAAQTPSEQAVTGPLEEVPAERSLDLRKAVPSWQHNLDWDDPAEEEAPSAEAEDETEEEDDEEEPTPDEVATDALLSSGEEPFEFQSKEDLLGTIDSVLQTGVHGMEEDEPGSPAEETSKHKGKNKKKKRGKR